MKNMATVLVALAVGLSVGVLTMQAVSARRTNEDAVQAQRERDAARARADESSDKASALLRELRATQRELDRVREAVRLPSDATSPTPADAVPADESSVSDMVEMPTPPATEVVKAERARPRTQRAPSPSADPEAPIQAQASQQALRERRQAYLDGVFDRELASTQGRGSGRPLDRHAAADGPDPATPYRDERDAGRGRACRVARAGSAGLHVLSRPAQGTAGLRHTGYGEAVRNRRNAAGRIRAVPAGAATQRVVPVEQTA